MNFVSVFKVSPLNYCSCDIGVMKKGRVLIIIVVFKVFSSLLLFH